VTPAPTAPAAATLGTQILIENNMQQDGDFTDYLTEEPVLSAHNKPSSSITEVACQVE